MKLKVKKRPIVQECIQWTGENWDEIKEFCGDEIEQVYVKLAGKSYLQNFLHIKTLEGDMRADLHSYIMKGMAGEFWAVKESIMEMTYVRADFEVKADDMDVMAVEELVGMGCGAWDAINPKEIIDAAYMVMKNKVNK